MRQAFLKNSSAVVGKFSITYKSSSLIFFEIRDGKIFVFSDYTLTHIFEGGKS